jgi:small subunit ribosomal protein S2
MKRQPDAIFIVDLRKEQLAVREARRLGLPVIALVDTNCDPDEADYVIPGNDDAIRSCDLIVRVVADAIEAGRQKVTPAEMAAATNGAPKEEQPQPEEPSVPEGDYEQVSPGEEPAGEAEAQAPPEQPEPEQTPEQPEQREEQPQQQEQEVPAE